MGFILSKIRSELNLIGLWWKNLEEHKHIYNLFKVNYWHKKILLKLNK